MSFNNGDTVILVRELSPYCSDNLLYECVYEVINAYSARSVAALVRIVDIGEGVYPDWIGESLMLRKRWLKHFDRTKVWLTEEEAEACVSKRGTY